MIIQKTEIRLISDAGTVIFNLFYYTYRPDIPKILIFQRILNWLKIFTIFHKIKLDHLVRRIETQDVNSIHEDKWDKNQTSIRIDYTSFEIWINTRKVTIRNFYPHRTVIDQEFLSPSPRIFYSWQIYRRSKT